MVALSIVRVCLCAVVGWGVFWPSVVVVWYGGSCVWPWAGLSGVLSRGVWGLVLPVGVRLAGSVVR